MSQAEKAFRDGDLAAARRLSQERIRKDPTAVGPRTFLVQLLALLGEWDRARQQLSVLADIDKASLPLVFTYGPALEAEPCRARVFSGAERPVVFGRPDPWTALLVEALALDADGRTDAAADLRASALEQAPATPGRTGEDSFAWIADADDRLGPVLETIVNGQYIWVPFHQVRTIRVEPPREPIDLVWAIAQFTWANGGQAVGLIPARYPGTEGLAGDGDPGLRLGRLTEWRPADGGTERPFGQRMLVTDGRDHPILDLRELDLEPAAPEASEDVGGTPADG
jgi:type VI secretion system protein ImpE